jgi:hypothetical protein
VVPHPDIRKRMMTLPPAIAAIEKCPIADMGAIAAIENGAIAAVDNGVNAALQCRCFESLSWEQRHGHMTAA